MIKISDLYFTEHFNIVELCATCTGLPNWPLLREDVENMQFLCHYTLEPIRQLWRGPITVNSGFRRPKVNAAVGGVPASQHLVGLAADITTGTIAGNRKLWQMIQESSIDYDQLILERGGAWIHVSWSPNLRFEAIQKP